MYQPRLSVVNHQTHVAVIGCGYWGMNYVRVLSELPDSRVTVVCDERTGRLDEVARRFPDVPLTTSIEEALDDDAVEAAVICTQAATHREIAGRALALGKHVLVEKPLTVDVAEADELIELAEKVDRVLLTGHTFLYNDGVRSVKTLMDDGALGDLYYLYARRTNLGPFRADVNALWDLAPHDVAIFNYLLDDDPEWVSAVGARVLRNGREDVGFISLGYPGGLVGHIHVSWADPHKVREFVVVGSDRRIVFNDLDAVERVRVFDSGVKADPDDEADDLRRVPPADPRRRHPQPRVAASEPLKHLSGTSCTASARGDRPLTSGRDGRDVVPSWRRSTSRSRSDGAPVDRGARAPRAGARNTCRSRSLTSRAQQRALAGRAQAAFRSACSRTRLDPRRARSRPSSEEFAAYCEVPHAVGVDSGLSALELALRAAGIGPGDEVITAANTFIATVLAISHAGATPVLVDADPETPRLDPEQVDAAVTSRTRASCRSTFTGSRPTWTRHGGRRRATGCSSSRTPARRTARATADARRLARARRGVQLLPGEEPRRLRRRRRGRHDRRRGPAPTRCACCATTASARSTTTS